MTKRFCLIILGLLLVLSVSAHAAALPEEGMVPFDMAQTPEGIYYLCRDDLGQVRLYLHDGLALKAVGSLLPETDPQGVTGLVCAEELMAYNGRTGQVFALEAVNGRLTCTPAAQLDFSLLKGEKELPYFIQSAVLSGQTLYVTYYTYEENASASCLAAFNLASGSGTLLPIASPICAAAYQNGQLLMIVSSPLSQGAELAVYDPPTHTLTPLAALEGYAFSGLGYDAASDTAYYLQAGKIMALTGHGPAIEAAAAPYENSYYTNAQGFIREGVYYNFDEGGPYGRQVSPLPNPAQPFTIHAMTYDKGAQRFAHEAPEITLEAAASWQSPAEMQRALAAGQLQVDGLFLEDIHSLNALISEGLAADLSQHEGVRAFVESCSPQVKGAVMREGRIYALPLEITGSCLAYDPQVLSAMGLTEKDLPRTYEELFAFLTRWNRQWATSGYLPMDPWGLRSSLFYAMTAAYADQFACQGQPLTFDTPLYKRLAKGLMDVDLSAIEIADENDAHQMAALHAMPCLFTEYSLASALTLADWVPWPLSLEAGAASPLGGDLKCLVICTQTTQPLAAQKLLTSYLEAMDPGAKALLSPDTAQAVENAQHHEALALGQAQLAQMKAQQAQGALDLSGPIAQLESRLSRPEVFQYIISPQRLTLFRQQVLPRLHLRSAVSLFASAGGDDLAELEQKFLQGELSPSQFVRNMERLLAELGN